MDVFFNTDEALVAYQIQLGPRRAFHAFPTRNFQAAM